MYKEGSWKSFDRVKSKELLEKEIEICNPDLLILLGSAPLRPLQTKARYSEVVDAGEYIVIKDIKAVVTPFPSGNGLTQKKFGERMHKATELIKDAIGNMNVNEKHQIC